ncbi:probable septum site-determining protein minC [Candidatus Vecturithrix granuli]|uniref:Probable septum site-determining protein MinC n=1 Tax=Vecturithrix granuli TaxID=1499967 RepID=A0A081BU63_VECG1|nr:probable septum site-determining protein minC [Candidatus Vecturithrix granuli]
MRTKKQLVEIKGQKDGLWIYLDDQDTLDDVFSALDDRLKASNRFFSGAEVTIDTGIRKIAAEDQSLLRKIVEQTYALQIKEIRSTDAQLILSEESSEFLFDDLGSILTRDEVNEQSNPQTSLNDQAAYPEKSRLTKEASAEVLRNDLSEEPEEEDAFMKYIDATFQIPVQHTWEPKPTYSSEHLYENEETAFYFRGTVRSGQTLEYPGNIVILGDINPGAYVIASGDIIVMGRLQGVVHAGAEGEERAVVIGASFTPSQLRIAQYIGRSPDEYHKSRAKQGQTEKAYVKDGAIVIEPIL